MDPLPLKDIHLPTGIDWWPPALGWWLVAIVLPLLILGLVLLYRRLTRQTAVKAAQKLLQRIRQQPDQDPLQTLSALSVLLRRTALSNDPRDEVAQLHGQAWLEYLDRLLPDAPFSQGEGRCLADGHFRPNLADDTDLEALLALCERWLKQQDQRR